MAAGHRAGEGDETDARIGDHAGGLVVAEMQELEDALRQAGGLEGLGIALGDERRLLRHLQDHRVAGEDRRHDGIHRGEPGIVPRRDDEHDADRLAADESPVFVNDHIRKCALGDRAHVHRPLLEAATDLVRRVGDRPAHLPRELFTDGVRTRDAPFDHSPHDRHAVRYGDVLPDFLCFCCLVQRVLDPGRRGERALDDDRAVDGTDRALDLIRHRPSRVLRGRASSCQASP
jgi:hypothetical protein